jgi:hypothetical protein
MKRKLLIMGLISLLNIGLVACGGENEAGVQDIDYEVSNIGEIIDEDVRAEGDIEENHSPEEVNNSSEVEIDFGQFRDNVKRDFTEFE